MIGDAQERWRETFGYARKHSPFYREWLRKFRKAPALEKIRPIDKAIVSRRNLDFVAVPRERIVEMVTTSGTTGQPLVWMLTDSDLQRLGANERMSFQCAGLSARDNVLVAVSMDRCFIAGLAYWLGLRELGCGTARVGAASPTLAIEMIKLIAPSAIVAVPSFLRLIAEKARELKFDLKKSSLQKAICIGEPIRDRTLALNATGAEIEKSFGAQLYSTYGVTELANSLCECDAGAGGHLHAEHLYLEALDDNDQPVEQGEVGEIVATTFGVEGMPLIRYRTGDCASLNFAPCACGRTTPRIGPIVGRKNQRLKYKGASLFPSTLQSALENTIGVDSYVIVARADSELSDSIEVLVHGSATAKSLRERLQGHSKIAPQIRHASRQEIETLQMPPQARKRRTFVDLR